VRWAFADRVGGASAAPYDGFNLADHVGDDPSAVRTNRGALAAAIGVAADHVVPMAPVHGPHVAVVDGLVDGPVPGVDGLVTATPGLALLVVAADCVPVLLGDDRAGVVAVVHSGWRGVRDDVVGAALETMASLGAAGDRTEAVVGPAVCGSCYAVGQDRFDAVVERAPLAASRTADGRPALDLRGAVVARLRAEGVAVRLHGGCTQESPTLYSFRRDDVTGRHGGVVALVPDAGGAGEQAR
jgi:YfiH family protein